MMINEAYKCLQCNRVLEPEECQSKSEQLDATTINSRISYWTCGYCGSSDLCDWDLEQVCLALMEAKKLLDKMYSGEIDPKPGMYKYLSEELQQVHDFVEGI